MSLAEGRVSLAHPIDVARQFDATIAYPQITGDQVQNSSGDLDLLASYIEDAESEFHDRTDAEMRIGRQGTVGVRETFEQPTYKLSGHRNYKRNFAGVFSNYERTQKTITLEQSNILPFDSDEGDQIYVYRGLASGTAGEWEEITDEEGELWGILNHVDGTLAFHPEELYQAMFDTFNGISGLGPSSLENVRFAISYRYGGLGGSLGRPTRTDLAGALDDTETGTVAVADGSGFPTSSESIVVLIGDEYLVVEADPTADQLDILERGVRGTVAEAHSSGDRVRYTPPAVRKAVAARAGMQLIQGSSYSEWLPDADDALDKNAKLEEMRSTWEGTVGVLSGAET